MGKQVTVLPGYTAVLLPSPTGPQPYNAGQTAVLTDAEYAALPQATLRALSTPPTTVPDPNRPSTDPKSIPAVVNTNATGTITIAPGHTALALKGNVTIAFSGLTGGNVSNFTLEVTQDATARTLTYPASVKWSGGTPPTLTATAGKVDMFEFKSRDGGVTIYGRILGQNY